MQACTRQRNIGVGLVCGQFQHLMAVEGIYRQREAQEINHPLLNWCTTDRQGLNWCLQHTGAMKLLPGSFSSSIFDLLLPSKLPQSGGERGGAMCRQAGAGVPGLN